REHVVALEEVEHGTCGAARERIARVRVRMQEPARHVLVVERAVDLVGGEHARKRQISAGDALREAQEVRRDVSLLAREHRPGAPEPRHDLVGDEEHLVARAELARAAQELWMVEAHAARALHEGLHHECRDLVVALGKELRECVGRVDRAADPAEAMVVRMARGKGRHDRGMHERRVRGAKDGDVRHSKRALPGRPRFAQKWNAILSAISVALAPSEAKKAWPSPPGASARRRSASSIAGAWVKPASITCSSFPTWSTIASLIAGCACPKRFTHQELTPSR